MDQKLDDNQVTPYPLYTHLIFKLFNFVTNVGQWIIHHLVNICLSFCHFINFGSSFYIYKDKDVGYTNSTTIQEMVNSQLLNRY